MSKDDLNTSNRQGSEQKPRDKIEIVDENLKQGFAQMPRPVLRAKGLSFRAKCIYNLLLDYAWQGDSCFPGQDRLAVDLDTSVDTIQRGLKELKDYRLIDWKQAGLNRPNIYYILKLSDCCFLHPDTDLNGKPQKCGIRIPHWCGVRTPHQCGTKNTKSKNTQIKNTKSFRKANALKPKKEENEKIPGCSHRAPMTTRKRKVEETREQKGRGVTFSPDKEGTTNKQDVQRQDQQVTPASMIPKLVPENTERGTNGHPSTTKQTATQKRVAKIEASKHPTPVYIGKPLTQEEIDEKRRNGQNASGFTPLSQIPVSHWQELETRAAAATTHQNGNGIHYSSSTKHAPDFIDALIEQFSKLLHDEQENIPQNINRAAKLYRQSEASEEMFISLLHDAYTAAKRKQKITTLHSDGRPNKMLYFFSVLEDKLGLKPKQPN